ncbi:MAG: hypothetical protein N2444_05445, partial [Methylocystis sp.]|nr:hypothetical protein [Methylocystis sp.]
MTIHSVSSYLTCFDAATPAILLAENSEGVERNDSREDLTCDADVASSAPQEVLRDQISSELRADFESALAAERERAANALEE